MRNNIEAERGRLGLTKKEISLTLGISQKTYSLYIRGKNPIPSDTLLKMARLFNCSTDYLLGYDGRKNSA